MNIRALVAMSPMPDFLGAKAPMAIGCGGMATGGNGITAMKTPTMHHQALQLKIDGNQKHLVAVRVARMFRPLGLLL